MVDSDQKIPNHIKTNNMKIHLNTELRQISILSGLFKQHVYIIGLEEERA